MILRTMKEGTARARVQQHDTKQRKQTTKKLEDENKKMEIRLQELKLAMNREKEERENQDDTSGFWGKGQTGSLLNYKVESQKKPQKAKKIGVLKDDPIVVPKRSAAPGTMAYLAHHDPASSARSNRKPKGPKCGQCEDRVAAVTCQECGEDYCTKCFAVFHLKGALRKHRTTPISTVTPRQSARQPANEELAGGDEGHGALLRTGKPNLRSAEASAGGGPSQEGIPSAREEGQLIQEMMRSQERQQVRTTNGSPDTPLKTTTVRFAEEDEFEDMDFVCDVGVGSTYRAPVVPERKEVADSSIGTDDPISRILLGKPPHRDREEAAPDIQFTNSLSYAERLLLKQNRRRQLERLEDATIELRVPIRREDELRAIARQQALNTKYNNMALDMEAEEKEAMEQRVDFQALCDLSEMAVSMNSARGEPQPLEPSFVSRVIIEEEDFTSEPENHRTQIRVLQRHNDIKAMTNGNALELSPSNGKPPKAAISRHHNRPESVTGVPRVESRHDNRFDPMTSVPQTPGHHDNRPEPITAVPRIDSRHGNRSERPISARTATTPRSARRAIPDVPRPASRKASNSARRVHNLTSQPADRLRAVTNLRTAGDFRPAAAESAFLTLGMGRPEDDPIPPRPESRSSASQLANRFYSLGPRSWRPDSSLRNDDPVPALCADVPTMPTSEALPQDFVAEMAAIEAMAHSLQPSVSPVPTVRSNLASKHAVSRASTSLTAVTSRSIDSTVQHSIVVDGDDLSSFDRMASGEEEEEEEAMRGEMNLLEREISSQRLPSQSLFLNDVDAEGLEESIDFSPEDSLDLKRSLFLLSADHNDSDSLDSLDTARYDDASSVRDLK